jgi:hypothetical protein
VIEFPEIIQGFRSILDLPTAIYSGDYCPEAANTPTVYYRDSGQFLLVCVFHRKDWSQLPWPLSHLDEHDFDFEGGVIGHRGSASVFHHDVKHGPPLARQIFVEPCGHGIEFVQSWTGPWVFYPHEHYRKINIDDGTDMNKYLREHLQEPFNRCGVQMPWQWADGKFWNDPASLLR